MAIREVLTSFTFEQQRQMINLIGIDVGDVSTLLTPTLEVVTAINEVITGDVDLSNQTIGMDDGTLASPSLYWDAGQGFYKVDANKIALTTSLAITGDLEVDGDITFRAGSGTGGTLTFGDLNTDNIVFNADVQSSIVPDSSANYNLGSLSKQWNNIWIDGTASIDTLTVDENATITGNLTVSSGNVYVPNTQTIVDLFDDYATTVEAFGAGTSIRIGDTTGTLTLRNPTIVGTQTSLSLFDTIATNVNAFGAASEIYMGVTLGGGVGSNSNFTIRSDDTILVGDLNVNGGEILSSQNTFDLLINNSDVRIGAANGVGNTIINNSLTVKENLDLSNSGTIISIRDNTAISLVIREANNSYMTFTTTDAAERVIVHKDLYVVGNLDVTGTSTIINTSTLTVDDINITLGDTASPTDALANGGGITLKGTTDKTITYNNSTGLWTTNIGLEVANRLHLKSTHDLVFGDNDEASISWESQGWIFSESGTFGTTFRTSQFLANTANGVDFMINAIDGSGVYLYYNGDKVFETTTSGVLLTGTTGNQLTINETGSTGGSIKIYNASTGSTSTDGFVLGYDGSNNLEIRNYEDTDTIFYRNDLEKLRITSSGIEVNGLTSVQQITEVLIPKSASTGTVVHDFSTGSIFYHSSITSNFTINLTNVPTTDDRSITVSLMLDQGGTGYYANALEIDGVAQTIRWFSGTTPVPSTNNIDVQTFTLLRTGSTWYVLGQLSTYD